ncbi:class I SAM-dependent methyltransferase [Aeromicrobium sp. CF3.5]|uniref:class I SAM-dependent methyltransferase n=1 Tax=Aeromicrobium sp. CF3.5 TaxID=3373078 RepID=UPI003EE5C819
MGSDPFEGSAEAMHQLAAVLPRPAVVLEVGSGTGYDADLLESLGLTVRRTDATESFLDMQRRRGLIAERLNVLTDDLGGPYDAVQALCVLIHVLHVQLPDVLRRIFQATRPGGYVLLSMREGEGLDVSGDWHTALWPTQDLESCYTDAGLVIQWQTFHQGRHDDRWNTHLLRRPLES